MSERAADLRDAFDRSFADRPIPAAHDERDFVGILLGAERYAVALEEIVGIVPGGRIVPVPSRAPHLLGVVGLRGRVVPVFSLERMLGRSHDEMSPRWLLVVGAGDGVAFGFERFDGYLRAAAGSIAAAEGGIRNAHLPAMLTADGAHRPILSIRALLESISKQSGEL